MLSFIHFQDVLFNCLNYKMYWCLLICFLLLHLLQFYHSKIVELYSLFSFTTSSLWRRCRKQQVRSIPLEAEQPHNHRDQMQYKTPLNKLRCLCGKPICIVRGSIRKHGKPKILKLEPILGITEHSNKEDSWRRK